MKEVHLKANIEIDAIQQVSDKDYENMNDVSSEVAAFVIAQAIGCQARDIKINHFTIEKK